MFFTYPVDVGGLGPSFAPPIQRTAESSYVAGALSFDAFTFFTTNAGALTLAQTVLPSPLLWMQEQWPQVW
jgi:hypothetical protein